LTCPQILGSAADPSEILAFPVNCHSVTTLMKDVLWDVVSCQLALSGHTARQRKSGIFSSYIRSKRNSGNRPLRVHAAGSILTRNSFGGTSSAVQLLIICILCTGQNRTNAGDGPWWGVACEKGFKKALFVRGTMNCLLTGQQFSIQGFDFSEDKENNFHGPIVAELLGRSNHPLVKIGYLLEISDVPHPPGDSLLPIFSP
jgi:hypothetical protein